MDLQLTMCDFHNGIPAFIHVYASHLSSTLLLRRHADLHALVQPRLELCLELILG